MHHLFQILMFVVLILFFSLGIASAETINCEIKKQFVGHAEVISTNATASFRQLMSNTSFQYEEAVLRSCDVLENPASVGNLRSRFYFQDSTVVLDDYSSRLSEIRILPKVKVAGGMY